MACAQAFDAGYFQRIYRNYARQNPPRKLVYYRRIIEKYVPPVPRPTVLDLGCAFGWVLGSLSSGWRKFGIDLSEYAIQQALNDAPTARFAVASSDAVPLRGPFDGIFAFDVLEHVKDLDEVARYVSREMAPGAAFVFVVPVYDGPLGWLVRRLDRDPTHIHKKPRAFWLDWASTWFEVAEWHGVFRYLIPAGPYINWPSSMLRSVAPAIAIVARKQRTAPQDV